MSRTDSAKPSFARRAHDLTAEGFGPGFNGPLIAVVNGGPAEARQAAGRIGALPDVATLLPPSTSADGRTTALPVIPKHGPDTEATQHLVEAMRDVPGVAVTGTTAANIDISQKLGDALPPFVAAITLASLLLLTLAFRSVLVPIKAVVTGFAAGGRVVTAAALIMIAVFGGFVAGHDPIVQPIALAVGVAVDAFVVRMGLVPAAMALLGRAAWWFPRVLDRAVPHVALEGEPLPEALPNAEDEREPKTVRV